ncbi:MAG: putative zinc-binding metallopeptidase [Gammaproteobacteria bacterium]
MPKSRKQPEWVDFNDEELLDLRFCDLGLKIGDSPVQGYIQQLYDELKAKRLRFRPHCWFAEEWFSPDGVPGIGVPFYLAHKRLRQLEQRIMLEVEGGTSRSCMRLLRHEAGHAIDSAWRLHNRKPWQRLFGDFRKPYPTAYTPRTQSKNYVLHLDWWYAQSHPAEDFAETFAVWLKSGSNWRRDYAGWPVLRKLEYVDELMTSLQARQAPVKSRECSYAVNTLTRTLREHYDERRQNYSITTPELFDADLKRLFSSHRPSSGRARTAAAFLQKIKPELCRLCAHWTGEYPYSIGQIVQEMILRSRELKLYLNAPEEQTRLEVAIYLSAQTLNYLHQVRHRIPM